MVEMTAHGKGELVVWDEFASSDDESDPTMNDETGNLETTLEPDLLSPGANFESKFVRESFNISRQMDMPVTGLERAEETKRYQISLRSRVRERIRAFTNLKAFVSDTRFLDDASVMTAVRSLARLVATTEVPSVNLARPTPTKQTFERSDSDISADSISFSGSNLHVPLSPASIALAEVLIAEISLKNKNRLELIWNEVLQDHYLGRLTSILVRKSPIVSLKIKVDPGLEKCVTGLLRLTICAVQREDAANDILASWKYLLPQNEEQHAASPLRVFDKHFGEGKSRLRLEKRLIYCR
jgi:hypothetical protein